MVHRAKHPRRVAYGIAPATQSLKRHSTGALVKENPVDGQHRRAVALLADPMLPPDLFEQGQRSR